MCDRGEKALSLVLARKMLCLRVRAQTEVWAHMLGVEMSVQSADAPSPLSHTPAQGGAPCTWWKNSLSGSLNDAGDECVSHSQTCTADDIPARGKWVLVLVSHLEKLHGSEEQKTDVQSVPLKSLWQM
jgi:hypothetical protein